MHAYMHVARILLLQSTSQTIMHILVAQYFMYAYYVLLLRAYSSSTTRVATLEYAQYSSTSSYIIHTLRSQYILNQLEAQHVLGRGALAKQCTSTSYAYYQSTLRAVCVQLSERDWDDTFRYMHLCMHTLASMHTVIFIACGRALRLCVSRHASDRGLLFAFFSRLSR